MPAWATHLLGVLVGGVIALDGASRTASREAIFQRALERERQRQARAHQRVDRVHRTYMDLCGAASAGPGGGTLTVLATVAAALGLLAGDPPRPELESPPQAAAAHRPPLARPPADTP